MDRKRKSVFSSHAPDSKPAQKVKKQSHSQHDTPRIQTSPCSRFIELQNNTQKFCYIIEQLSQSLESADVMPSEDVLKAAADLNRALQRTPLSATPPANFTSIKAIKPQKLSHNCANSYPSLPPLPLIIDTKLEKTVFTLPAMSSDPTATYDRLEILGDAYIELIATKLIWRKLPEIPSGRISQIRETLVKNETLADYTTRYGLDSRVSFPQDYLKQPKRLTKTKGDLFEAYVAAVVLSQPNGYSVVEDWLSQLWIPKLEALEEPASHMHAKQALARRVMRRKGLRLNYIDEKPPIQHEGGTQTFFIGVYLSGLCWDNRHLGSGQGLNKAVAGNKAAQQALRDERLMNEIANTMQDAYGI
ncbi:ribonuclease III domain-containing protein [Aspergillus pseudoustus]|uniref:Ribonuclease III domain-containing protein n=1 Tax=Aspergillus pseudoustus TaxID=1810923 RepID=A0ABR4IWU6_9EURO